MIETSRQVEVKLVVYASVPESSDIKVYDLTVAIGMGVDDINLESVTEELRNKLAEWALSWLRYGYNVALRQG